MPAKGRQALVIGRGNEPGLKDQSKSSAEPVDRDFPLIFAHSPNPAFPPNPNPIAYAKPGMLTSLLLTHILGIAQVDRPRLESRGLMGYIGMDVPVSPDEYGYGVSLYATAWPLVQKPIRDFQIGLASIWILPDNRNITYPLLPHGTVARDNWPERGPSYWTVFETIEGGLGFWANTDFGSTTAKFRMNGTSNGYNHEISSPGWAFGGGDGRKALRSDQMGIAQLSSRLLVPPDGLTFKEGTNGDLLGYAWMALPLIPAKSKTAGLDVPTGEQCWTLFLNSNNFRGPVAFYTPSTWSRVSRDYPPARGRGLDARPGVVNGGAIEVNTVPRFTAKGDDGAIYNKIPKLQFPADKNGRTVLIHNLTHYSKGALYNQVASWVAGGSMPTGRFSTTAAKTPECKAWPLKVNQGTENLPIRGFEKWVETTTFDGTTFGLQWKDSVLEPWTGKVRRGSFPEYTKKTGKEFQAISASEVPISTGLVSADFPHARKTQPYTSPTDPTSVWMKPGPKAGPYKVKLSDGSTVTYYWYRFIDQPALQDADLSPADKDRLQRLVEKMHRQWTPDKQYIPAPKKGDLTTLDRGIVVKPPKGLEVGYVPIAVRQD